MKYIFMIIIFILIFTLFLIGPEAEETVLQSVYYGYTNNPTAGYFTDIGEAIDNVADKGRVYIGRDIEIKSNYSTININKSIELTSLRPNDYQIGFFVEKKAFNLEAPQYFKLNGIKAIGNDGIVISGTANKIDIINSSFNTCIPIKIDNPSTNIDINISHNKFNNCDISIDMKSFLGSINLSNNIFQEEGDYKNNINLKNIDIIGENNRFRNTALILEDSKASNVDVTNNVFDGDDKRIKITADGRNMSFKYNKIIDKNMTAEVYYDGATPIDFTQNWWGSGYGPKEDMIGGSGKDYVNFNNWALFQDFSRYKNDPYTLEDLEAAIDNLRQAIDEINFLYDFDNNNEIELLDLIWLTRSIE